MKNRLLLSAIKSGFLIASFFFSTYCVYAQTYTIPWAQQQPSWVFPLWFENGNGERDTLYYCVDTNANGNKCNNLIDSIYGEMEIPFDSQSFHAYFECIQNQCEFHTSAVVNSYLEYNGFNVGEIIIFMCNASFPITIRWDKSLLYSDSLPLPDQDPAPRAQGLMSCNLAMSDSGCGPDVPILMTDTITSVNGCVRTDSMVFTGTFVTYLKFTPQAWTGNWVGIESYKLSSNDFSIVPNPVDNYFRIKSADKINERFKIIVYDILGEQKLILHNAPNDIDATNLKSGLYFLRIVDSKGNAINKLFIKA